MAARYATTPEREATPSMFTATEGDSESDYEGGDDDSLHPQHSHHHLPSCPHRQQQQQRVPCTVHNRKAQRSSSDGSLASTGEDSSDVAQEQGHLLDPRLTPGTSKSEHQFGGYIDTCQHNSNSNTDILDGGSLTPTVCKSCPVVPDILQDGQKLTSLSSTSQKLAADQHDYDHDGIMSFPHRAYDKAEELARRVWEAGWTVVHHQHLPKWLRDNDFLIKGHRPPLHSFRACFNSIFRIHTETGNIWTHLLGFIAFLGVATYFMTRPSEDIQWQEKAVFSAFFLGAILCLGFSTLFHTVYCHSERVGKLFNKLDYCGIALLTMGSFVPWLYYSFYCRLSPKIIYLCLILVLGTTCIVVSMWDKFAMPKFRALRAGVFIALGLSGVVPAMHYVITDGFYEAVNFAALGWLVLMAFLYITGAVIYAVRIPERIWPGKFDIWFQSHQIFHMFVIAAAFVHFHGISKIANYRLSFGDCLEES